MDVATSIFNAIQRMWGTLPFSTATWLLFVVVAFCIRLFVIAHRDPKSPVDWEDLILSRDAATNERHVDPYRLGYLVGAIFGSWIVITLADGGHLTFDMFGVYLAYLLGGAGWISSLKNVGGPPK